MRKPILCLDFDGVVHSYTSGWMGATVIPDPPVPGALKFIAEAMQEFTVAIYSSRSSQNGGISAMCQWLGYWSVDHEHGMGDQFDHAAWSDILWATEKPSAMVTLDDRAITFNGVWPSLEALKAFQPWYKKPAGPEYAIHGLKDDDPVPFDEALTERLPDMDLDAYEVDTESYTRFHDELVGVINRYSMENGSDTPDFLLAEMLTDVLISFDRMMKRRDGWYGGSHRRLKGQLEAEGDHTAAAQEEIERLNAIIAGMTKS